MRLEETTSLLLIRKENNRRLYQESLAKIYKARDGAV
jgi:hypothetical protein